ncbi:DUF418 domain-containing protein [Sphingomonas sp. Tas61C01]|uniref:DUF418 domain-containing protein n=1 Tax=Sphingomonas sp. Tas61C01 TaxID=3458297 RepID=UPI00403E59DE
MTTTSPAEPDGAPRIAVLDILRGLAILGILFMNVADMGGSIVAASFDVRHLGWSWADRVAWWLREVLVGGTARAMLELLFGAGMVILTDRADRLMDDRAVRRSYGSRNLVLFAFGLIHVFVLLWPGDILHTYAIAATIAVLFRRQTARALIAIGFACALWQLTISGIAYQQSQAERAEAALVATKRDAGTALTPADRRIAALAIERQRAAAVVRADTRAEIAREDEARTGSVATWARAAWRYFVDLQRDGIEALFVWQSASVMLIGAALFKLGILQGGRSRRWYVAAMMAGYALGLALRIVGAAETIAPDDAPRTIWATYEIARLATALGHLALVNLLVSTATGARLLRPFAAAGRAALTIYIAQTLICLWILFPPFALGWYGRLGWAQLMLVAFAVDLLLLLAAIVWFRRFAIAPIEWAWRSLVETRPLPWR